ncbi:hypothetical protein EU805_01355 [Salipiger sp. IMCC34102]|uniref:hypothetical protein n=1 Tax=Salipiger sp. IMCC34102 TaxID=2510647 RepID=UPI00101DD571|nr:hypothetical protein [Salipiger sp. IMCC34102]RYH04047.1 hypothetical protein EU805_01355 [Salipiger sp. IMCC34102]
MASFFSTVFLGLIAAAIGALFQDRSWRYRNLAEMKERERSEARQTVERLSDALDRRITAQRAYTEKVIRDEISEAEVAIYRLATSEWMGGYSSNLSRIHHSFGYRAVLNFEKNIQDRLQRLSAVAALGRRYGKRNLSSEDREDFENLEANLSLAQHAVTGFLRSLNDRIEGADIGRTRNINNLNSDDLSLISRSYLIRRLFAVDGKLFKPY